MNILVLRALGLGDLLTGVPALRAIRRRWPSHRLWLATTAWLAPIINRLGVVDKIVPQRELSHPVRFPPSTALTINLHGKGPQSRELLAACPAPTLSFNDAFGPKWIDDEHDVTRWCRLLSWYGVPTDPKDLALPITKAGGRGPAIVHPGAKDTARRWPPERYADVCRWLERKGERVVITGTAAEVPLAAEIAKLADLPRSRVLAGRTDTEALAAMVASASVVVCGDTGVAHLATACGTRSIVLFASLGPHLWGPPPDRPQHRALWHPDLAGLPFPAQGPHPALAAITTDEVLEALSCVF